MRVTAFAALLLLLTGGFGFAASAQPASVYVQTDPPGDVQIGTMGQPSGVPVNSPAPRAAEVDITELTVEDPSVNELVFRLRNAAGFRNNAGAGAWGMDYHVHFILFQLPDTHAATYLSVLSTPRTSANPPTEPLGVFRVAFCVAQNFGLSFCNAAYGGVRLPFVVDAGVLEIRLPKDVLVRGGVLGRSSAGSALPELLEAGSPLAKIRVLSYYFPPPTSVGVGSDQSGRLLTLMDRLPNVGEAPPYHLKHGMSAPDLPMTVLRQGVIGGEESQVPLYVHNRAGNKRLINLTAEWVAGSSETPWKVGITPTLTLAADRGANVSLRVSAPATKDGVATATVRITARILNEPGRVSVQEVPLVSTLPLDETHKRFFFHRAVADDNALLTGSAGGQSPTYAFLSRFETDVHAKDDGTITLNRGAFLPQGGSSIILSASTAGWDAVRDAVPNLATIEAGVARVHLEMEAPFAAEMDMSLYIQGFGPNGNVRLAEHRAPVSFKEGRNVLEFDAPLFAPGTKVGGGVDAFHVTALFRSSKLEQNPLFATLTVENFRLAPKSSWFELPIKRDPEFVADENLPKISITAAEDTDAFVNPGRQTVFEAVIANAEPHTHRIELVVDNASLDWPVSFLPSQRLRLAGNDSIRVGIAVAAPTDIAEGDIMRFRVQVRLTETGARVAELRLLVIGTRGIEIETETFEATGDETRALDVPTKKSPAFDVGLVMVAIAVLGLIRARRGR